ncbi:MAG: histidinol-phosphate transaminase [Betaproteobacteria bacterium]|nr:histidinol-phosphate transaminase [Betaproteobacteria bacterium]
MNADLVRDEIRALHAYPVADARGFIKLDAMESPFAFPASLRAGLADALAGASLNRYPSADAAELKAALRRAMRIPDALDILLGNGSDEIIQLLALAVARPGATILSVEPAFVMFRMIATYAGLGYTGVPLNPDFTLDRSAWRAAIRDTRPALIFLASPNNPTGNAFPPEDIEATIEAARAVGALVVIDEAYFAYADTDFLGHVAQHDNVVLMRTVSKLGLAGLRLGLLVGRREWLEQFDKVRLPYNINALTQAAATFALAPPHYASLLAQARGLVEERARVRAALCTLPGVTVHPSQANFVLIRVADAAATFEKLLAARILVKNTSKSHPLLAGTLRLTIGAPHENDALLAALRQAV